MLPHPRRSPLASRALRHPPYCTRRKLQHETLGLRADFCLFSQRRMPAAAASSRIMAAPFSAIMIVGALVLAVVTVGMTEASITRSPCDPAHPQPGIDHGHRVLAHPAGADDVIDRRALPAHVVGQRLLAGDIRPGRRSPPTLCRAMAGRGEDAPRQRDARERDPQVVGRREVVGLERRAHERVGRLRHDRAAALGPGDADRDGHAGLALQRAELVLVVARRREQQLDVGARQALAAAGERLRARHAEGQRAAPRRQPARDLARQPQPARQLVDRHRVPDPVRDADRVVVGQVGADARQIVHHRHADRLQMRARPDARHLQQVRRVDGAARQDHLARRRHLPVLALLPEGDAGAALAVEQQPRRERIGLDAQVRPRPCACARKVRAVEPRKRPLRDICE